MELKKKIIVLTQFYAPEGIPFPEAVAKGLNGAGHDITVITGFPNRPGGKLFPGYKQRFGFSEEIDGIEVHRVPLVINHSQNPVARVLNFLSFSVSSLAATSKVKNADAVYVYATPATAAIPAQLWKKFFRIPYVLHVQDIWPESVTESGMVGNSKMSKIVFKLLSFWTNRLYRKSDMLIAISGGMKDLLIERGNSPDKIGVVYNWANEDIVIPKPSDSFESNSLKLLYAGNLGPMQDLEILLQAAELMDAQSNFRLTLAGGGILEDQIKLKVGTLPQIDYVGMVSADKVSELYLASDFQLVTLKNLPIFRVTVPSKFQSSLASGVPVITTVKGAVADLIQQYEAGLVAEPENPVSLKEAFQRAQKMTAKERASMGRNARKLYEELMSADLGKSSITAIMEVVAGAKEQDRI